MILYKRDIEAALSHELPDYKEEHIKQVRQQEKSMRNESFLFSCSKEDQENQDHTLGLFQAQMLTRWGNPSEEIYSELRTEAGGVKVEGARYFAADSKWTEIALKLANEEKLAQEWNMDWYRSLQKYPGDQTVTTALERACRDLGIGEDRGKWALKGAFWTTGANGKTDYHFHNDVEECFNQNPRRLSQILLGDMRDLRMIFSSVREENVINILEERILSMIKRWCITDFWEDYGELWLTDEFYERYRERKRAMKSSSSSSSQ